HGITVLSVREGLKFDSELETDSAPLNAMVGALVRGGCDLHVLRDPTRGGVGTTLNEIAQQSGVEIRIRESDLPIKPQVRGICDLLGFDPLYMANEGKLMAIVPEAQVERALDLIRKSEFGREAAIIGEVTSKMASGQVVLETGIGGLRPLDMLTGEQLPRIC
ncbi:MAG: AIR synthase-related protein, partial [Desulfovibrionales bacterium]|nr:AIR synthase-related protein [Desulfovibrionales bacterium]